MGIFQNTRGRVSKHARTRVQMLNQEFPVGSRCRYTNPDGREEVVTVASPFCLIEAQPMGLFKEKVGWQSARVRELAPEPWRPPLYS